MPWATLGASAESLRTAPQGQGKTEIRNGLSERQQEMRGTAGSEQQEELYPR